MVLSLKPHGHRFLRAVLLVLALAVSIATILTITHSVYAQTDVPDAPTNMAVYNYKSEQLEVRWSSSDAASTTSFKVQWKWGSEEFSSSRQSSIDPATRKVELQSTSIVERYMSRISRLSDGREYTVRVIATNANGDSDPSEEATGTPYPTQLQGRPFFEQVGPFIEREVIEIFENSHPWLRETWDYTTSQNVFVTFRPWAGGTVHVLCPSIAENNLWKCNAESVEVGRYDGYRNPIYHLIVHELGHVYSLANGMASNPGPLGIAHLYLDDLVFPSYENLSDLELFQSGCDPSELYADALLIVTFGDGFADDANYYWSSCNLITDTVSDQALAVFRSAAAGEMPSWFADTYNDADGDPDLERLWLDVKAIRDGDDRRAAVFQLRNSFGGYCDNQKATDSVFGSGTTRNPWRDGGCVPDAPTNVSATPGSYLNLTVSWQEPVSDGGSPIEGYKVQWKSGNQEYSSSRQEVVADPIIRDNGKFSVLLNRIWSSSYNQSNTIRVLAYNQNGDGAATEITVTPNPATGAPTISGTAEVGETLTAGTSGISDVDGLANATFTYQWLADEADISGATGSTHTLVAADEGKAIRVRVSFTDDRGNQETLTSETTGTVAARPNSAASGAPTISGTTEVGETLTADTSGISDVDGLANATFTYQWLSSRDTEIDGATSSTYTLTDSDEGKAIKVRVNFTDDRGNQETLTGAVTPAVEARPNSTATGEPTISGTLQVRETLSASTSGIADTDGLANVSYSYQWIRNDGSADTDIQDTTGSSYTLVDADEGKTIKAKVSFTDDAGHEEALTSAATAAVEARPNSTATGEPTISGTVQVRETLTANTSGIADTDGLANVSYSFQWIRNDGSTDTDIQDATGSSYTLVNADEGKTIKVKVSFTDDAGHEETLTSAATASVKPPLTAAVHDAPASHDGENVFTFELRFSEDPKPDFSYTTVRDHAFTVTGGSVTYVRRLEAGKNVRWEITVTPGSGAAVAIALNATTDCSAPGAICTEEGRKLSGGPLLVVTGPNSLATGVPTITGTAQVGETLTAGVTGISDGDGLNSATFAYQWLADDANISGATDSSYTLFAAAAGKAIRVRVTFTDDAGNGEELTSAATSAVAAAPPPPNTPATGAPAISGTARVSETLTASTTDISDADSMTRATFSYQWLADDSNISGATNSTYTVQSSDDGKAIKVMVSFTDDAGNDEELTSAATGTVTAPPNTPAMGVPTISGTAQVGETLTSDSSGIADDDGLTNASLVYQWLADDAEIDGATASTYTLVANDAGKAIKVMVSFTDDAGNDEQLTSAVTGAVAAAVVNPPLTASVHNVPSSHNGQDAFIFELRFGEAPEPDFSYRTVRDHAFTVTGGSVTYVRRLEPGKNVRWEITVTPDSSADVAIALNATTDCEAVGAICTSDGERLSASVSAIVSGPVPVGTVPVAVIVSETTPVAEGATVSFTISLNRAAPTALSVVVSVADAGGVLSGAAPRSVAFATSDNSKTITLPTRDDNAIKTASTVTVSLATGSGYTLGTATSASVSVTDNDTAVWTVSAQPTEIAEGGSSTITLAVANGKTFTANQTVSLAVSGTASGSDYSLSATELTLPAGASSVTATLTARDDASVESDETVIVTATHDGQPIGSATVTIEANDVAVWTVSAQPTEIAEGGSSTITLAVANGKTFTADQSVSLAVSGTASGSDYSLSATELTLPADASSVTATLTARDDANVERDETVIVTATYDGQPIGSATVTIEANDVAVWTVSAQPTEIAEGGSSTITLAVANGKTFAANQTVSLTVSGTASGSDYSLSATELTLPADTSSVTATLTARDDASVERDETVIVTATHDGQPIGSATVTIEANDVPLSNDATLSTLSLSGIDIGAFSSGTTDYSVIVEYDVASTTVTADPNDDGASVAVADANGVTYGTSRQVSLSSGDNEITVTVTAEDENAMKVYTVTVTRSEPDVAWGERLPDRDIVLDSDAIPTGLWADDTNAWVISDCNVGEVAVYALSDGSKQDELSFTLADWSGCATALWSNGATLWVADFFSNGVRAYRLSDGARQSDQDLDRDAMLAAGNTIPSGLWSNGEIMWVADHSAGKVFAYRLSDWARVSTREFDLTDDGGVPIRPFGLWSNGETLLASNWNGDRVLAYDLSDGQRQTSLDIDTSASGTRNSGIWSDGETLWIVDDLDKRIYAYAVQGLGSAR